MLASRLAVEWSTSHAEAVHIALSGRPDDLRRPYVKINLKVLTYLLDRYGHDPNIDRTSLTEDRSRGPSATIEVDEIGICLGLPKRPLRTSSETKGALLGIAEAAGDAIDPVPDYDDLITDEEIAREERNAAILKALALYAFLFFTAILVIAILVGYVIHATAGRPGSIPGKPGTEMVPGPLQPGLLDTDVPGPANDAKAEMDYTAAYDLLINKKDQAGARPLFMQCVNLYSQCDYMNTPVPPGGKTRLEVIKRLLRAIGP